MAKSNGSMATVGTNPLAMLGKAPTAPLENFQGSSPWVQFQHAMAKNHAKVCAALGGQVPNGTPVYCGATDFAKLEPFEFICTPNYSQGYALFSGSEIVEYRPADGTRPAKDWREIISAFILVVHDGQILPARCEFRTTKCAGFKRASDAIAETAEPHWVEASKERKKTADVAGKHGIPTWALLTHTGTLTAFPPKDGKTAYEVLSTSAKLTSPAVLSTLAGQLKTEEFSALVNACITDQSMRIESFNAKVKK